MSIPPKPPLTQQQRQLVERWIGLVGWCIGKFEGWFVSECGADNLRSDLHLELCECARRYDPTKGAEFNTYAISCLRFRAKTTWNDARRDAGRLTAAVDHLDPHDLLDETAGPSAEPIDNLIDAEAGGHDLYRCRRLLDDLQPRHREILLRRADGDTFAQIAAALGVSRSRAAQIHDVALAQFKKVVAGGLDELGDFCQPVGSARG